MTFNSTTHDSKVLNRKPRVVHNEARAHVDMMAFNLGAKVSFETGDGRHFAV